MQNQENFTSDLNIDQPTSLDNQEKAHHETNEDIEVLDQIDLREQKIAELEQQVQATQHAFLLARADLENQKKRHQDEIEKIKKFAIEGFASQLLGVMDALSSALSDPSDQIDHLKKGVELTHKQLQSCFERFKIAEVDALGQTLDPALHQVISTQASDAAPHTIIQVLQKGYKIQDRLLRPAMVITAAAE
jgi:molecular chaperone GrpE